ncbi:hypothetical protein NQ314_011506 [Rhamnusium bicolor]|uniref:Uncharacterized protein n=1 Tax=Rhamnusium bicolor TaxID=1586634 RepID=A0AAV8XHP3_9CUCU|nr:hypothetical protein NQ314_011506 [Rhamnusium bicolor]
MNISDGAISVIISSIFEGMLKQYNSCYKKWWRYCIEDGATCSTVDSYKSALSLILNTKSEDEKVIKRFLKEVSNVRPSVPKYSVTWDPRPVFEYLSRLFPLNLLSQELLTLKLTALVALISAH